MGRILILDDDCDKSSDFKEALVGAGHEVVVVNNTKDALTEMGGEDGKFDLLITDTSRFRDEMEDPDCHNKIFKIAHEIGLKVAVASSYPAYSVSEERLLPVDDSSEFVEAVNSML
ncbi:MAG: hypothetical protein WC806_01420 [Candidatus Gracilibacteria bacterium]|jgi:DNA-binding NtrC family response regulator